MAVTKRITIDQLRPGMFVVGMDQPWYKTPFLFHKRLVADADEIGLLRRHGIHEVLIDTTKGIDLEERALHTQPAMRAADDQHTPPNGVVKDPQNTEGENQVRAELELSRAKATAARVAYGEAMKAVERVVDDLENGHVEALPRLKKVVGDVVGRILDHPLSMLTQFCVQKMQQFDRTLTSHAMDVCVLSLLVAHEFGCTDTDREEIGIGALLHDVGYLRLPRNLYRKARELNVHERSLMQQHPQLAETVCGQAGALPERVRRIIIEHHERLDGSGFPQGLSGQALLWPSQIVGIVDTYDGMVSYRTERPPLLPNDAIRQLFVLGEKGRFDKALVEVTIKALGVYPVGSLIRLNTGERAIVVGVHADQRMKPVVKIITDPQGERYGDPLRVDLSRPDPQQPVRAILRALDPNQEHVNVAMYFEPACEGTPR